METQRKRLLVQGSATERKVLHREGAKKEITCIRRKWQCRKLLCRKRWDLLDIKVQGDQQRNSPTSFLQKMT